MTMTEGFVWNFQRPLSISSSGREKHKHDAKWLLCQIGFLWNHECCKDYSRGFGTEKCVT
jgi:hypothetical protein